MAIANWQPWMSTLGNSSPAIKCAGPGAAKDLYARASYPNDAK